MIGILKNFYKYAPLLKELVSSDLKKKYRRSILGYLWSLLNPLFMMIIVSAVFSYIFRNNIENYPIYLIIGQTFFNFYSEATNSSMKSLIDAGSLMKKIYIPKYIFPLAKTCSSFVNLMFSLVAVILVVIFTGTKVTWLVLFFPLGLIYITLFCIGVGLVLSIIAVYFRDMLHLYKVLLTALMYLTPIFYSVNAVSPKMMAIVKLNPMYMYITYFRNIILNAVMPTFSDNLICFGWGFVLTVIGLVFFKKKQDGIILYV